MRVGTWCASASQQRASTSRPRALRRAPRATAAPLAVPSSRSRVGGNPRLASRPWHRRSARIHSNQPARLLRHVQSAEAPRTNEVGRDKLSDRRPRLVGAYRTSVESVRSQHLTRQLASLQTTDGKRTFLLLPLVALPLLPRTRYGSCIPTALPIASSKVLPVVVPPLGLVVPSSSSLHRAFRFAGDDGGTPSTGRNEHRVVEVCVGSCEAHKVSVPRGDRRRSRAVVLREAHPSPTRRTTAFLPSGLRTRGTRCPLHALPAYHPSFHQFDPQLARGPRVCLPPIPPHPSELPSFHGSYTNDLTPLGGRGGARLTLWLSSGR